MPAKGEKLLVCPGCKKRGVSYRMTGSDDMWGCRYCDWYAFANGHDRPDVLARRALQSENLLIEIWVTDPELSHLYLEDED